MHACSKKGLKTLAQSPAFVRLELMLITTRMLSERLSRIATLLLLLLPVCAFAQSDDMARYLGYWAVSNPAGDTHYLLVKREGEVTSFSEDAETKNGTCELVGDKLMITYPSGVREVLSASSDGFVRNEFAPGVSIDAAPDNFARARRVSRKEVGELAGPRAAATVTLDPDILLERLLGFWQVADGEEDPYFIEVRRFGRATKFTFDPEYTRKIENRGEWEILPNGLHVTWEDGLQDVLRIAGRDLEKATFAAGASIMSTPAYTSGVAKSSFNEIEEVIEAAADAKRQATLAMMATEAAEKRKQDEARAEAERQAKLAQMAREAEARRATDQESLRREELAKAQREAEEARRKAEEAAEAARIAEAARNSQLQANQEAAKLDADRMRIEAERRRIEEERARAEAERQRREQEAERRLAEAKIQAAELARQRETPEANEDQRRMEEAQRRIQEAERLREQERALAEAQRRELEASQREEYARMKAELARIEQMEQVRREAERQRQVASRATSPNSGAASAARSQSMNSQDVTELYNRKAALLRERAELEIEGRKLAELERRMKAGSVSLDKVDPAVRSRFMETGRADPVVVFQDDFEGLQVDSSKWSTAGTYNPMQTQQIAAFKADNATVVKSNLELTAYLDGMFRRNQPNNYSSALVSGAGKFEHGLGLYEFRVQVPEDHGLHSQISLISTGGDIQIGVLDVAGQQPDSTRLTVKVSGQPVRTLDVSGVDLSRGSHIVSVDVSAQGVVLFIDHIQRGQISASIPSSAKFYPAMALNVGSDRSGPPNGWTNFPATLSIDSVRVYSN